MNIRTHQELAVQKYLKNNIVENLKKDFAISCRRSNSYSNLILLKYHLMDSPMSSDIVRECRGLILDENDNWRVISRSFDKFFNYDDFHVAKLDSKSTRVYDKLDGSILTMYFYNDAWQVQTSGLPDASGDLQKQDFTFNDLFWRIFDKMNLSLPDNTDLCYIFELTSLFNRVLVKYEESMIRLIGVRNRVTQQEHFVEDIEQIYPIVESYDINDIESVHRSLDGVSGFRKEGYVLVDKDFNRAKIKSDDYKRLFKCVCDFSVVNLLDLVRNGKFDSIAIEINEWEKEIRVINKEFLKMKDLLEKRYEESEHIINQKKFAKSIRDLPLQGVLFSLRSGKTKSIEHGLKTMKIKNLVLALNLEGMFQKEHLS